MASKESPPPKRPANEPTALVGVVKPPPREKADEFRSVDSLKVPPAKPAQEPIMKVDDAGDSVPNSPPPPA